MLIWAVVACFLNVKVISDVSARPSAPKMQLIIFCLSLPLCPKVCCKYLVKFSFRCRMQVSRELWGKAFSIDFVKAFLSSLPKTGLPGAPSRTVARCLKFNNFIVQRNEIIICCAVATMWLTQRDMILLLVEPRLLFVLEARKSTLSQFWKFKKALCPAAHPQYSQVWKCPPPPGPYDRIVWIMTLWSDTVDNSCGIH